MGEMLIATLNFFETDPLPVDAGNGKMGAIRKAVSAANRAATRLRPVMIYLLGSRIRIQGSCGGKTKVGGRCAAKP